MATLALTIFSVGLGLWLVSKKPAFLFVTGVGVGLLWGALWAAASAGARLF